MGTNSKLKKITLSFLLILGIVLLLGCGSDVNPMIRGASDELIYEQKDMWEEINIDYEIPYIDYNDIFLKMGEEQPTTGRYANETPDGKIDWTLEKQEFDETPIAVDMMSKITLDGKPFTLPAKFQNIGEEYAVFDKIDFSKFKENMSPFVITDVATGNKLSYIDCEPNKYLFVNLMDKNNTEIITVTFNLNKNNISGIGTVVVSKNGDSMTEKEIKVDGMGVGNTKNEIYEKFATPQIYKIMEYLNKSSIRYIYINEFDVKYIVYFTTDGKLYDYRLQKENTVRNNVITCVGISIWEDK